MRPLLAFILILVLTASAFTHAQTGLRITSLSSSDLGNAHGQPGPTSRTATVYVLGPNSRTEATGSTPLGPIVTIQRCDSHVVYMLAPDKREYMELPLPSPTEVRKDQKDASQKSADKPANLLVDVSTVDTGETKQAFGHTAHHYITTTRQTPSPDLADFTDDPTETIEDVWYLDIPDVMSCMPGSHRPHGLVGGGVSIRAGGLTGDSPTPPAIRPEFRYSGPDPQGLVLSSTTTTQSIHRLQTGEKQTTKFVSSHHIENISQVSVDLSLFDVPADFTKVEQFNRPLTTSHP